MPAAGAILSEPVSLDCQRCGATVQAMALNARYCPACRRDVERERFRSWYERNRGAVVERVTRNRQERPDAPRRGPSWTRGAPGYPGHLPGAVVPLRFEPEWRIEHRHVVLLHGLVTALTGDHDPRDPRFALVPDGESWAVYLPREQDVERLTSGPRAARLGGSAVLVHPGEVARVEAPERPSRRRHRVRVDALTPVQLRTPRVTGGNLTSTLTAWTARRLGLPSDLGARCEIVSSESYLQSVPLGHVRGGRGHVGHWIVDVNAPALWLLRCAEVIGLGAKAAYGFGRIACAL